jgi:hypothetical protein
MKQKKKCSIYALNNTECQDFRLYVEDFNAIICLIRGDNLTHDVNGHVNKRLTNLISESNNI